jgi:pyruvate dehydrogenase E1 component
LNQDVGKTPKLPPRSARVTLLGSGAILTEVIKAARLLADEGIESDVFSVTSWSELARDGAANPIPFIARQLASSQGPIIAATDYVRAVPESVRAYLPAGRSYTTLGTDGFGRSDTRAALREFFGVDAASIVRAAKRAVA